MKKLILSAAILLGSLSTFAQTTPEEQKVPEQNTTEKVATATDDGYTEIKNEDVPAAITAALKKAFPEATLNKAFINDKKEYKIEVKNGEKVGNLFADANGKWIQ